MPGVEAVEVFSDDDGYIVIRQEDRSDTDSQAVYLLPVQVPTIIKWLERAALRRRPPAVPS
jgi:hypothetical protein